MSSHEILYSQWAILIIGGLFLSFWGMSELGCRLGLRVSGEEQPEARAQIQAIEAAILTLLGLLLAFTFSMSGNRFETRKANVVEEANAIGTAYLRASVLPSPERKELEDLLRVYAKARIEFYEAPLDLRELERISRRTDALQQKFWALGAAEARKTPTPILGLVLSSLNAVIDLREKQTVAFENHVPESILLFLLIFSSLAGGVIGYLNGIHHHRRRIMTLIFATTIAMTIFLVIDLDRPRRGLIRVHHESLTRLLQSIEPKP